MRLQRLKVEQLRQFRAPFEIDGIEPGLNLFVGENEAGKSTLVRAIRAAFFERHRSSTVEDLRPWGEAAAAPTIELDFTVGDTAFHLRKSFLQRKRCELKYGACTLDGEEAEQHLAELLGFGFSIKGASRPEHWGIPGLLWIEQGQGHLIKPSVENAADHLRKALDASVGEVASTQGDALIAKVRTERDLLLTPKDDKPRGELKRALDERDELQVQLAELDARIEAYRRQVDQLAALKAEHALEQAARPWDALRLQQQAAEQALAASEVLAQQLDAEKASLQTVEDRLQLVEQQLAGFDEDRRALAQREAGLAEAAQRLEAATAIEARRAGEQAQAEAAPPTDSPTLFVPFATMGESPVASRNGYVRSVPDPTMAPAPAVEGTGGDVAELPAPLRGHVAGGIDALPWRQVTRGVHEAALPLAGRGGERATLLRIAAGRAIPRHTHRGNEMTLVLDGDFADEGGHYGRGDLSITDPTIEHQPVAGQGRDCLCLVVTSAPIRLTGPLMRLLNPFLPR